METDILKRVIKKIPVDIEFKNLDYNIGKKQILNSICGKFQYGQLTAILGSSGSGKTTLLNVLAGHVQTGINGSILVNGTPRKMKSFRRISCYLMQDDALRSLFTVTEAVTLSAKLRLGKEFSSKDRILAVKEIIKVMGLEKCCDTRVEHLSGGERKRLSIALEIVGNPPVLFLDEPTTGLDYAMAKTFIHFLKSTAQDGRTIICTIHQPSDSMFQLFDQVYFLSNGYCIYNGDPENMVPFLANADLTCPTTYSPFDYILELVQSNEELTRKLSENAGNGEENMCKQVKRRVFDAEENESALSEFPVSFWEQSCTLTCRTLTQMKRSKFFWATNLIPAVSLGLLKGCLFWGVGNDGARFVQNVHLFLTIIFYHLFQQTFTQVVLFPFEVKIFQREYANRWYSLNAYYTSLLITALPSAIIPALLLTLPLYFMTDQPLELHRFLNVMFITILAAITSQALGHALGSLLRPMLGAVVGSAVIGTIILMITYGNEPVKDVPIFKKVLLELNFARHGFAALCTSLLKGRDFLRCDDEIFCYFRDTDVVLRLFGFEERQFYTSVICLILFLLLHKFCLYVFLRLRVTTTSNAQVSRYMELIENKISGG